MHDSDHYWAEQHKDATQTKIARDVKNTQQVLRNTAQRSSCDDPSLKNIATGVTALWECGKCISISMAGNSVEDTHSRRNQTITMDVRSTIKVTK